MRELKRQTRPARIIAGLAAFNAIVMLIIGFSTPTGPLVSVCWYFGMISVYIFAQAMLRIDRIKETSHE